MGNVRELGVYIHYPWCRRRCDYCDFAIAVAPLDEIPQRRYLEAVHAELEVRAPEFAGRRLVSIYLGGGTPSLWPAPHLGELIGAVRERFGAAGELEVTLEANPTDCSAANLKGWGEAGITRLSIGVQSLDRGELATLGRDHSMGDGLAALERSAGAFELSADVILGTPRSSAGSGLSSLGRVADLAPPHVSVYELTVEERAPLGRAVARGDIQPLSDERLAELFEAAHRELTGRGYEHYEISSYARPGRRAVHNSLYWRGAEYLGLGASAASFRLTPGGAERWENVRSVGRYLAGQPGERIADRRTLDRQDVEIDRIWLGLRTSEGVGLELLDGRDELREWLLGGGLAEIAGGSIRPTLRGFLFADRVAARVLS